MRMKSVAMEIELTEEQTFCYYNHLAKLVEYGRVVEIHAFLEKNPDACQMLMKLVQRGRVSFSLLMLAAVNGQDPVVRLILKRGSTHQDQIEQGGSYVLANGRLVVNVTPLWLALWRGHYNVACSLIHLGNARIDHGPDGHLLLEAVRHGRLPTVCFLIENGYADVNGTTSPIQQQNHTLYLASSGSHRRVVDYLLSSNVRLNEQCTSTKDTALHVAVLQDDLEITRSLCVAGALGSIRNARGATPLIIAAERMNLPILDMLLDYNREQEAFDDVELVASSILACHSGPVPVRLESMKNLLRLTLSKRILFGLSKRILPPLLAFDNQQECQSTEELTQIQNHEDRLYTEALLIEERILRVRNSEKLFKPLLKRFCQLVTQAKFDRALNMLFHFFDLKQTLKIPLQPIPFIWVSCKMIKETVLVAAKKFLIVCDAVLEQLSLASTNDHLIKDLIYLLVIGSKVRVQFLTI